MPTYQYRCKDCSHDFEIVQAFTDDALTSCPECQGALKKVYGNVGISFKGSGFYKNDARSGAKSSSNGSAAKSESATTSSEASSDGSSGSSSTSDSGSSSSSDSSSSDSTAAASASSTAD